MEEAARIPNRSMNQLKKTTQHKHFWPIIIFVVLAVGFLIYSVSVVGLGAGTTQSKASRNTFLTPGDDALSLQQDLNNLGQDPGASTEQQLNSAQ